MKTTNDQGQTATQVLDEKAETIRLLARRMFDAINKVQQKPKHNWADVGSMHHVIEGLTAAARAAGAINDDEAKEISGITY